MGWFSKHIMGGDDPMDAQATIVNLYGNYEDVSELPKKVAEKKQLEVFKKIDKEKYGRMQVFGVILLNKGAVILPEVKEAIMDALNKDAWAETSLERRVYVNQMKDILSKYDNKTPTKEYEEYPEIDSKEWLYPEMSRKINTIAVKYFEEYCRDWPIVKSVKQGLNGKFSYNITVLIDESNEDNIKDFFQSNFEFGKFMDFNIIIIGTSDFLPA